MLKDAINFYIQNPTWLSDSFVSITQQDSMLFPWMADERVGMIFNYKYRLTSVSKLKEKDIAGTYYLQAIDLGRDDQIDILVITDKAGRIIEEFIFKLEENRLSGEVAARSIHNREQRIVENILQNLKLPPTKNNMRVVLELILDLKMNPFSNQLSLQNLNLLKLLINFDVNVLRTKGTIDFRKINFILERLKKPWSEAEARTILQIVNNYEHVKTIKNAEKIFDKIGGMRNVGLIIHKGKYHGKLIAIAREHNLEYERMVEAIKKVKNRL
jgi:hypothetical protein